MQKALPRPAILDINSLMKTVSTVEDSVENEIAQEMALLIANDALKYPISGGQDPRYLATSRKF